MCGPCRILFVFYTARTLGDLPTTCLPTLYDLFTTSLRPVYDPYLMIGILSVFLALHGVLSATDRRRPLTRDGTPAPEVGRAPMGARALR